MSDVDYSVRVMFRPINYVEPSLAGGEGNLYGKLLFWKTELKSPAIYSECQVQCSRSNTIFTPAVGQTILSSLLRDKYLLDQVKEFVRTYLDARENNSALIWHHHRGT